MTSTVFTRSRQRDRPHGRLVAIGVSTGAFEVLSQLLPLFPAHFPWPIVVVQHLHQWQIEHNMVLIYDDLCALPVKEASEKEPISAGFIYFAPANYHLLANDDLTFALSIDSKVHFTRPAVDVFFESVADAYGAAGIGVILTGANHDGAAGLRRIKQAGGLALVEAPETAVAAAMPLAAVATAEVDMVAPVRELGNYLLALADVI